MNATHCGASLHDGCYACYTNGIGVSMQLDVSCILHAMHSLKTDDLTAEDLNKLRPVQCTVNLHSVATVLLTHSLAHCSCWLISLTKQ